MVEYSSFKQPKPPRPSQKLMMSNFVQPYEDDAANDTKLS